MSHVVELETQISDLTSLERACDSLGLVLKLNQKNYKWYGRDVGDYRASDAVRTGQGHCDHAIAMKEPVAGAYEIGLVRDKTSEREQYKLNYDFWGQRDKIEKLAGNKCEKLLMHYAAEVTKRQAKASGHSVTQKAEQDGSLTLTIAVA